MAEVKREGDSVLMAAFYQDSWAPQPNKTSSGHVEVCQTLTDAYSLVYLALNSPYHVKWRFMQPDPLLS